MNPRNRFAFKEWAVVCEALRSGRQLLILRKGGIHEGRRGFQPEHEEFWLFPTKFHQNEEELIPEARPLLETLPHTQPPGGQIAIRHYVSVTDVLHVSEEELLPRLTGFHILSEQTLRQRFHYRQPGLFLLISRVYELPEPIVLADTPHFAGCRSWVDFPEELPTEKLLPVISDGDFERERLKLLRAIYPVATA